MHAKQLVRKEVESRTLQWDQVRWPASCPDLRASFLLARSH